MKPAYKITLAIFAVVVLTLSALGGHYKRVSRLEFARDAAAEKVKLAEGARDSARAERDTCQQKLGSVPQHSDMQRTLCPGGKPICRVLKSVTVTPARGGLAEKRR